MNKSLLFALLLWTGSSIYAQVTDTIVAWTFPTGIDTVDIYPDICTPDNVNRYIAAEDTAGNPISEMTFTEGAATFAATSDGWDNGVAVKLWSIKFKAPGYNYFKVSSKQSSDIELAGPKDWLVQARFSGGDWVNVDGGTVVCGNDWTTGVVSEILLPEQFNNPGSTSIYVRWIMASNENTLGGDVTPIGISKIDDVVVTGEQISGTGGLILESDFNFYPNPVRNRLIQLQGTTSLSGLNIYSLDGSLVSSVTINGDQIVELTNIAAGIYYIQPVNSAGEKGISRKLIVL
jgi:hypothetical protein